MRALIVDVCAAIAALHGFPLWIPRAMAPNAWGRRLSRLMCVPAFAAYVVMLVLDRPTMWLEWIIALVWPFVWLSVHRLYHKDHHGRRLLETARGWVRRSGNRLVVTPDVTR